MNIHAHFDGHFSWMSIPTAVSDMHTWLLDVHSGGRFRHAHGHTELMFDQAAADFFERMF